MAEVVVLGTAQDGGLPHAGCLCANCRAARMDQRLRRLPASVGIVDGDEWALIDATNAFGEQLHRLWTRRPASLTHAEERYRPPETIILTHAHTGHYFGLWQLDRSVLAARAVRVLAPPATARFLNGQEPWRTMSHEGFIVIDALPIGEPLSVTASVEIVAELVPHRAEWPTDTVGLFLRGPGRTALYLPDIDRWDAWERDIVEVVGAVDVALLDGTFWARPTSAGVPHPPMLETMERLQRIVDAGRTTVAFTHLNHSNPALTPGSVAERETVRRGFHIAVEDSSYAL